MIEELEVQDTFAVLPAACIGSAEAHNWPINRSNTHLLMYLSGQAGIQIRAARTDTDALFLDF